MFLSRFSAFFLVSELMILGFISLLLTVFQGAVSKVCVPENFLDDMLPCKREEATLHSLPTPKTTHHVVHWSASIHHITRHLLAEDVEHAVAESGYCARKVFWKSSDISPMLAFLIQLF